MFEHVADTGHLARLTDRLADSDWVGLDTEFVRERTYWPKLCLVQVADRTGFVACVDAITIQSMEPLLDVMWRDGVTKVYHAGSQDLELFYRLRGGLPGPVFDTQIAAALTGDDDQIGYAAVVEAHTGVQLAKAHTRTDWSRRPLKTEELDYAADDVRYLPRLYETLCDELSRLGRMDWALIESTKAADPAKFAANPDTAWTRVKGTRDLDGAGMAILQHLAAWRERTAMQTDRPRRWILGDEQLVDIAKRRPEVDSALASLEGMPPAVVRKHAAALIDCVRQGQESPVERQVGQGALDRGERDRLEKMMKLVRVRAQELKIAPSMLATRRDCEALVRGDRPAALMDGWRYALIGEALSAVADRNG